MNFKEYLQLPEFPEISLKDEKTNFTCLETQSFCLPIPK